MIKRFLNENDFFATEAPAKRGREMIGLIPYQSCSLAEGFTIAK